MREMETMFLALADSTRLRILNLMSDGEVSVGAISTALNASQPKVSRHLAYLRECDLVSARRQGKSINYSIKWPADPATRSILQCTVDALSQLPQMREEKAVCRGRAPAIEIPTPQAADSYIYRETNMYDEPPSRGPHHNELDEFLL